LEAKEWMVFYCIALEMKFEELKLEIIEIIVYPDKDELMR